MICTPPAQWLPPEAIALFDPALREAVPAGIMDHYLETTLKMLFARGVLAVEEVDGSLMPTLSYGVLHG